MRPDGQRHTDTYSGDTSLGTMTAKDGDAPRIDPLYLPTSLWTRSLIRKAIKHIKQLRLRLKHYLMTRG